MNKNILIVDDENGLRRSYRGILEKEGFGVFDAPNAVEARTMIMREKIDLVLLDLNMPNIRGEDLFQVMRAFHRDVKVIISSVYSIDEQKKAASGADDFFDKSDGPKTLVRKVKFHLNRDVEKGKIVIIDDEAGIRSLYKRFLDKKGYTSECFSDCKSAIQYIKKKNNRFHLILLDISMPRLDVKDIFDIVRETHQEARVLVVSCHDVGYQAGIVPQADGYIDKSQGEKALIKKIEEMVNKRE